MTIKGAALLALVAMLLLSVVQVAALANVISAVSRGLVPEVALLKSIVYAFASLCALVFFFTFYKGASR